LKKAWSGSILTYGKRREIQTISQRRPNTFQKNASTVISSMHLAADAVLLKNLIFEATPSRSSSSSQYFATSMLANTLR
jgi:hypothetical protein